MLRRLRRWSLLRQLVLLLVPVIAFGWLVAWASGANSQVGLALQRARGVASVTEAVGQWAAQYRGVWVRSEPQDPGMPVGEYLEQRVMVRPNVDGTPAPVPSGSTPAGFDTRGLTPQDVATIATVGAYHSKSPDLVQRELSALVAKAGGVASVRVTSDRLFNPANAPTQFEIAAMQALRAGRASTEYHEVHDGTLYFARALMVTASCMRCHESPEKSPAIMRAKFSGAAGWGYKVGELAGVVSVSLPLDDADVAGGVATFDWRGWASLGGLGLALTALLWWLQAAIVAPLHRIAHYAGQVKNARRGDSVERLVLDADELGSSNEMHRLSHGVKAISRALAHAQRGS